MKDANFTNWTTDHENHLRTHYRRAVIASRPVYAAILPATQHCLHHL